METTSKKASFGLVFLLYGVLPAVGLILVSLAYAQFFPISIGPHIVAPATIFLLIGFVLGVRFARKTSVRR